MSDHNTKKTGLTLLIMALAAAGLIVAVVFYRAYTTRSEDQRICKKLNVLRQVLYNEHTIKLSRLVAFDHKHPRGVAGLSHQDIATAIGDERTIIAAVEAPCVVKRGR